MLYIVATPIGNLDDMTPRAVEAFKKADMVACEDTRRTWALMTHFGIPRPAEMISYRQGNEERVGEKIVEALRSGREIVLCSDGGSPAISDPGYRLVQQVAELELPMTVLPGASAATTALVLSGLPTSSYVFKGFPPRKPGALRKFFEEEKSAPHTIVVYEAPYRLAGTLSAALEVLGDRRAAICMELTKLHERVIRGWLSELVAHATEKEEKGEAVIIIAGNHVKFIRNADLQEEEPLKTV